MTSTPTIATRIRDEFADRRERRHASNKLRRELAAYTTRAEIDDLLVAIGDQDTADAEKIRSILLSKRAPRGARWPYAS